MRVSALPRLSPLAGAGLALALMLPGRAEAQDALATRAEDWLAAQPRNAYQVEALGAKLTTPQEAFAYVRDHVAFEPYAGVMKGAAGALLTHGANDCDRALLLAALLAAQGVEARIAYAAVGDGVSNAVLEAARKQPDAVGRMLETLPGATPPAADGAFDSRVWRESLGHGSADRSAEIRQAFAAQYSLLKPVAAMLRVPPESR